MGQRHDRRRPELDDRWGDLSEPVSGSRKLAPEAPVDPARRVHARSTTVPFETPSSSSRGEARRRRRPQSDRVRRDSFVAAHDDRGRLLSTAFDERLRTGARNVITRGLCLKADDDLIVVAEPSKAAIAAALVTEASNLGVRVSALCVDAAFCADQPLVERLLSSVRNAGASLLVSSVDLPRGFRRRMIEANDTGRHGHMVGVTEEMMRQSVRADFHAVHALGERLVQLLTPPCRLEVRGAPGTQLEIRCAQPLRWHNQSGVLQEPGWTNFPGGEIFTTPSSVEGTLVPDGGVWLPDGRCIGRTGKLRLHFAASRLSHADGPEAPLLMDALRGVSNARRVGQIALGTNISVLTPIGALLQDLKMPGLHLTLGDSCAELTRADFGCTQEIPLLMRRPDVRMDGEPLLLRGRYARHLLDAPSFQ
ncbi:MAG: aminopeptidase [Deltaproteobacteria bacterium]|nr:aminopeptidase [Deltaproteobacteria bacterium]